MKPQEMFWHILCKKIKIIQKMPDDILIDIISEMSEPLRVLNYDFEHDIDFFIPAEKWIYDTLKDG